MAFLCEFIASLRSACFPVTYQAFDLSKIEKRRKELN